MHGTPDDEIKSLDDGGLTDLSELDGGIAEPLDDFPAFDYDAPEVDATAQLTTARRHLRHPTKRLFADYRPNDDAIKTLDLLPGRGESLHAVMSQRHSMWDLIPAIIARTGHAIDELHVATLSYSAQTSAELIGLLDDGRIRRVSLIVSAYFKAQNATLYNGLVTPLMERGHRVLAMRNHAKLMLIKMDDGALYTCEGSANLRSCKNVEQFVLTRCAELYRFHHSWLEEELLSRCRTTTQ